MLADDQIQPVTETTTFLHDLYGAKHPDHYILLWSLPERRSHWVQTVEAAEERISNIAGGGRDVYIGCGLQDSAKGPKKRGRAEDIVAVPGLWIDLDIAHPDAHKKGNLPPTKEDALGMLHDDLPEDLWPSLIVDSGHGLQLWWLYGSLFTTSNPDLRQAQTALSQDWNGYIRSIAGKRSWDVDSTFDLSRVYRIPGTWNRKIPDQPKIVRTIWRTDRRYLAAEVRSQLDGLISQGTYDPGAWVTVAKSTRQRDAPGSPETNENGVQGVMTPNGNGTTVSGDPSASFTIHADADPPFDKFAALASVEPKFSKSWDRTRTDLQDQSSSSYDLSIATYAAQADWTDQEIANLIIASRRRNGDDPGKTLRYDYLERTIHRARGARTRMEQRDQAIDALANGDHLPAGEESTDERTRRISRALTDISSMIGIPILAIQKLKSTPPIYRLVTNKGEITLGEAPHLTEQHLFRRHVIELADVYMRRFKPAKWDSIAETMLSCLEHVDVGPEGSDLGLVHEWLSSYLLDRHIMPDAGRAMATRHPFLDEGDHVCIFLQDLATWLAARKLTKMSSRDIGVLLRSVGIKPDKVNASVGSTRTTRAIWRIPDAPDLQWVIGEALVPDTTSE